MKLFTRLEDHYGSDFEKWQIRKQLNYQSTVVSGPGWVTIGDGQFTLSYNVQLSDYPSMLFPGIGFTNPLLSPGINAGADYLVLDRVHCILILYISRHGL